MILLFLLGFFLGCIVTVWLIGKGLSKMSEPAKGKQRVTIYKTDKIKEARFLGQITRNKETEQAINN